MKRRRMGVRAAVPQVSSRRDHTIVAAQLISPKCWQKAALTGRTKPARKLSCFPDGDAPLTNHYSLTINHQPLPVRASRFLATKTDYLAVY